MYVYNLDGTGEVKITDSSAYANANFGRRVAVGEGKILVGSQYADPGGNANKGDAWVYNLDGTGGVSLDSSINCWT